MTMRLSLALLLVALPVFATVDFQKQVAPVLDQCVVCHGSGRAFGGVKLHNAAAVKAPYIVPGKPEASLVYLVLQMPTGSSPKAMPPSGQLPEADRAIVKQWIAEGAVWPVGVSLGTMAKKQDEHLTVEHVHDRIVSLNKVTSAAAMQPYSEPIPGTGVNFSMVPIPAGSFVMGTPPTEAKRHDDEGPQRTVTLDAFWMGKYEVTWDEYRLFMFSDMARDAAKDDVVDAVTRPTKPYVEMSFGMGIKGFPAISMTQHAANKYAEWLSAKTGHFYRLPTEAEWEYACRAGTTSAYSYGDDPAALPDYAWINSNSNDKYQKIGLKKPNPWGLFDMHGNVMEWTLDQYQPNYAGLGTNNPWTPSTQPYPHAVRGGSWADGPAAARCGARVASEPAWKQQDPNLPKSIWYHTDAQFLGFRLVRPLKIPSAMQMYRYWNNGVALDP